jgi:hypothetical protein
MSDAIGSPSKTQRAAEQADAKADTAPLKAFETALKSVQSKASAPVPSTVVQNAVQNTGLSRAKADQGASPEVAASHNIEVESSPRPIARSTTTALASSVQANLDAEALGKSTTLKTGNSKPKSHDGSTANRRPNTASSTTAGPTAGQDKAEPDEQAGDPLAATATLSTALVSGLDSDIKLALQSTLEGFASGRVPDAIKASLGNDPATQQSTAEISGLLDSIATIAKDILANGPLSDLDFASNFDQLFWVSNWFDLFSDQSNSAYDPMMAINYSVNSAMAMPMDILYTRAVMVPLIDVERVVSPGIASRRSIRANTEPVPGATRE